MTARRRLSVGLLEANLRVYFKELGASCMFELVQIPNADAEHEHFPFFVRGNYHYFTNAAQTNTTNQCVNQPCPDS